MIYQRHSWDCGHACLAYVLDKTLDEVLAFMPHKSLSDWQIGWALKIHSYQPAGHEIKYVKTGRRIVNVGDHWAIAADDLLLLCPSKKFWNVAGMMGIEANLLRNWK